MNGDDPVRREKEDGYQEKHTHNYDGISHIPQLCGSIPFIYNRVQAVVLLFLSKNYILLKASHKEKGSTEALDQSINPIWCSLLT